MIGDVETYLLRIQELARKRAEPLLTEEQQEQWERLKRELSPIIAALIAALLEGRITVQEWERLMQVHIRSGHTLSYAIGMGGMDALNGTSRLNINTQIARQLTYLAAFAAALGTAAVGVSKLSQASLVARAELYLQAMNATLNAGAAQRVGMPLLPAYPGDGTTRCRVNCKCHWYIEQIGDTDWDCYWMLGYAEHCENCPRRAVAWSPLEIRNGVLQPYMRAGLFL